MTEMTKRKFSFDDLENQMLKLQIDLLDKAQGYRCSPAGEEHEEDSDR